MIALALAAATVTPAAPMHSVLSMAGGYYEHVRIFDGVENAFVDNVAEIVPVGPQAAYVRIRLVFNYAHVCELWGIASFESDALVFDDKQLAPNGRDHCRMAIQHMGNALAISDRQQSCDAYCGAAVTFNGARFSWSHRRPITYLRRLKRSEQYRQSLLEWRNRKSGP